jgi:hypothetical protein
VNEQLVMLTALLAQPSHLNTPAVDELIDTSAFYKIIELAVI